MVILTAGALAIGCALSFLLPFLPFAGTLMTAVLIGAGAALAQGRGVGETILAALAVLAACQLGYGSGLASAAWAAHLRRSHRSRQADDASKSLERLHHERE